MEVLDRYVRAPNPREKEKERKERLLWANKSKRESWRMEVLDRYVRAPNPERRVRHHRCHPTQQIQETKVQALF
jgi:hypothetical protein